MELHANRLRLRRALPRDHHRQHSHRQDGRRLQPDKNSTSISDVDYTRVPNPSWPTNSIMIIDTASGKIMEDFLVDERGTPLDEKGKPLGSTAGRSVHLGHQFHDLKGAVKNPAKTKNCRFVHTPTPLQEPYLI